MEIPKMNLKFKKKNVYDIVHKLMGRRGSRYGDEWERMISPNEII